MSEWSIYRKAEGRARGRQRERESGNRSGRAEGAGVKGLDRPAGGSIQNGVTLLRVFKSLAVSHLQ